MSKSCLRCIITGRVQGVGYRANAQQQAIQLGIAGWIRNLPDGRVEALIYGEIPAIQTMQQWLSSGPLLARVNSIEVEEADYEGDGRFDII